MHYQCCCKTSPNEDDLKEVIVAKFQQLFCNGKVLLNFHLCCDTANQYCCRTEPNQDDSVEVTVVSVSDDTH